MFLLDTNVCIYLMKNTFPELTERVFSCSPTELFISSVTVFELEYGVAKSSRVEENHLKLLLFLAPFNIIDFDSSDALIAGQIRHYLEKRGTPIGPYDIQIASQGLARNMTVLTHNISEFSRVPNLKAEDWI